MKQLLFFLTLFLSVNLLSQDKVFPGADEKTPSRSEYFSWINNTNEGSTEEQTLINLEFFKWMKEEYGMQLDIYAFDAGAVDGKNFYGSMSSDRFKSQFPNSFDPIYKKAKSIDTRLGLWGGPDGFGDTPEEAQERIDMMVDLCKDYDWALFKMDAVCGHLREEKYDYFDQMMTECRKNSPDLILLNHRLKLGPGTKHSTTFLLGGRETYVDILINNHVTAPHHRATNIECPPPEGLIRLTEDHGVCISSYLDYWDDDLILQAFNRNLILAPQLYGSPWLLSDEEFPKLARIFNLHKKFNNIMVDGMLLPKSYGPSAVARGDKNTRIITLRNLNWEPTKYTIKLDEEIGLAKGEKVYVYQYFPTEKYVGEFDYGDKIEQEVLSFRACLLNVTTQKDDDIGIDGCNYDVVRDVEGKPVLIKLLGMPGTDHSISLMGDHSKFSSATIDGKKVNLLAGESIKISFSGDELKENYHRKICDLKESPLPERVGDYYNATCFAASNNALEVQSLERSGETKIPEVKAARDAFFNQDRFVNRALWDKYLFDDDPNTTFGISFRAQTPEVQRNCLRINLGEAIELDELIIEIPNETVMQPFKPGEAAYAWVSAGPTNFRSVKFMTGTTMKLDLSDMGPIRYVKIRPCPLEISEISGSKDGKKVSRANWSATNLFSDYIPNHWQKHLVFSAHKAWSNSFTLNELAKDSYLCIAINGEHGPEGAYAMITVDGQPVGCTKRAPSFRCNNWEHRVTTVDKNYTYYVPMRPEYIGKKIEAWVFGMNQEKLDLKPEVWISSYPIPFEEKMLTLE